MSAVAVLHPLELRRWPEGVRHGLPFLVSIDCPFCREVHTHGINAGTVLQGFTWTCTRHYLRHGQYRLHVVDKAAA